MPKEILAVYQTYEGPSENLKKKGNSLEVLDNDGNVRTSEEAVSVWCEKVHFLRLLGGPGESCKDNRNDSGCAENDSKTDFNDCLCAPITREEVL